MSDVPVLLIAALNRKGYIGKGGILLYRLPEDMKHFQRQTMFNPVIMGRKTWDSLSGPLKNRLNIVVTSDPTLIKNSKAANFATYDDVIYTSAVDAAIQMARNFCNNHEKAESVWVIGGASVYEAAMPYANDVWLTFVEDDKKGDVKFPLDAMRAENFGPTEDIPYVGRDNGFDIEIERYARPAERKRADGLLWVMQGERASVDLGTMIGLEDNTVRIGAIESLTRKRGTNSLLVESATKRYTFRFPNEDARNEAADQLELLIADAHASSASTTGAV